MRYLYPWWRGALAGLALSLTIMQTAHGAAAAPASPAPAKAPVVAAKPVAKPAPAPDPAVALAAGLKGPLSGVDEVVFCTRLRYDDPHWYANIGYYCDDANHKAYAGNALQPDTGKLYKWQLRTGRLTALVDDPGGTVRDPAVDYDGRTILFSWRKSGTHNFNLYEIRSDGTGLRQVTSGTYDDYEPVYLPDGGIAFISTRCKRWVNCWMTQVGVIYRCDRDGGNVEQISANTEHDNTPWVMPDGRLLYTRWEYVDRSQVEFHHLWTMNPDGTSQMVYYGNMHPHVVMIDAKPVPGTERVLASFSPGHGVNEHNGIATMVTPELGPDVKSAAVPWHAGKHTRDPYPLGSEAVLAARDRELVLISGPNQVATIYAHTGEGNLHEPRPLVAREREPVIPPRTRMGTPTGHFFMADVYDGRNLPGVKRGEIKKLLILESLPKQVNFSGGPDLLSWLGTFTLERIVGTVPVAEDGSAYFEVPANRQLFFVALDKDDLSVKRMQSFTSVMPGETVGCGGCHEPRARTAGQDTARPLARAVRQEPARPETFPGLPDVVDFHRDVQPVLDRHCVGCHNYTRREGQTILAGDLGPVWSHSFFTLVARKQVADGRNGLGNQPPRTIGSSASPLLAKARGGHHDVAMNERDWRLLWLWVESGATYVGSYAGLRNEKQQEVANQASGMVMHEAGAVLRKRCASCHNQAAVAAGKGSQPLPYPYYEIRKEPAADGKARGSYERVVSDHDPVARFGTYILLNFTRPEFSPLLLGPLAREAGGYGSCGAVFKNTDDPDYQTLLAALRRGRDKAGAEPRYGTPGFQPNAQYVRELKRFGILPATFDPAKSPLDYFAADQRYWQSLWPVRPQ